MVLVPRNRQRRQLRWTEKEDQLLEFHWGAKSVYWIGKLLDREPGAVYWRARKLSLGAAHRGTLSVQGVAKYLGFQHDQIIKMAHKLGLVLARGLGGVPGVRTTKGHYAITEDQRDAIEAAFTRMIKNGEDIRMSSPNAKKTKAGEWGSGLKPASCVGCQRTQFPHKASGLCTACHAKRTRTRRKNRPLPPDFSRDNERFEQILGEITRTGSSSP